MASGPRPCISVVLGVLNPCAAQSAISQTRLSRWAGCNGEQTADRSAWKHAKHHQMAVEPSRQLPITEFAHKAGVVGNLGVAAVLVLAACDMTPERCRAAARDHRHHLELAAADMAAVDWTPCRSMAAENIRNLQRRAGHGPLRRRQVFLVLFAVLARLLP